VLDPALALEVLEGRQDLEGEGSAERSSIGNFLCGGEIESSVYLILYCTCVMIDHEDQPFWCKSLSRFQASNRVISFTRRVTFVEP
jgi:hypothetical protein